MLVPVTVKDKVSEVPLSFCTDIVCAPGVTSLRNIGHREPTGQLGERFVGIVNTIVWFIPPWHKGLVVHAIAMDDDIGTLRAATRPSTSTVLLLVNPKPVIEMLVPTVPAAGLTEYSLAAVVEGGVTVVPQEICMIAARVKGPTKPVARMPLAA